MVSSFFKIHFLVIFFFFFSTLGPIIEDLNYQASGQLVCIAANVAWPPPGLWPACVTPFLPCPARALTHKHANTSVKAVEHHVEPAIPLNAIPTDQAQPRRVVFVF